MDAQWYGPQPRQGLKGWVDHITGPAATSTELWLQAVPPLVAMIAAPAYALTLPVQWSPLQLGLIGVLGFDLVGGVLTNATSSAKRWFHRPGQGWRQHLSFVAIHILHIGIIARLCCMKRGCRWASYRKV